MIRYLHLKQAYPFLKELHITQMIYYGLIAAGVYTALYLTYKRLLAIGYDKKQVIRFAVIGGILLIPLVYFGTRAAVMFHKPPSTWSLGLFIETLISGKGHTFHGGLIISFIFLSLIVVLSRLKYLEAFDTMSLYVPVGHAIGRVACLLVGCCWGKYVRLSLFGFTTLRFPNPVPLYAIGVNLAIFLLLRLVYEKVYSNPETRARLYGLVMSLYFMLYGISRIILELFRKERKIFLNMTQAQVVMLIFIALGVLIFIYIKYIRNRHSEIFSSETYAEIKKYLIFAGFIVSYLLLLFVIYHLSKGLSILPWPLEKAKTISDAYLRVPYYFPMLTVPVLALWWMKQAGISVREYFRWEKPEKFFYITCAFSVLYSIYLLAFRVKNLQGPAFWPPILVVCVMNAVSEELVYRLSAYRIFQYAGMTKLHANLAQSLLYSLIHFLMAGSFLGIMSFAYGIILAVTMDRNRSIIPPIICHFLIDIGCIGKPILRF